MASPQPRFVVRFWDVEAFFAELESCPESQQVRVTELLANVLPVNPKLLRPPLLKKLHGQYSHLWQFECGKRRLIYSVDDASMTVKVEYFGLHPTW